MKKTTLITLSVLLILAIAAVVVYKRKSNSGTIDKEASNFSVKDTASIDKIFLANKDGQKILLEKKEGSWLLDGTYNVRPDAIELLLYTIRMIEVKSPVSKTARNNVIKFMAGKSTKVEIYSNGNKVKQYYVGHTTQDHTGTFMLLSNPDNDENYTEPFITHIPGFDGFLSTRYNTDKLDWRDRLIINYRPPQIKQIKMELFEIPDSSFIIDLFSMQRFGLKILKTNKQIPFEEEKIKQFIAYFQNVNCEVVLDKNDHLADSLKSALPFAALTVTDRNNKSNVTLFYHKFALASKNTEYGVNYKYDPDRLFVKYNNGADYGVAQYYVFGKMLQTYRYFMPYK